MDFPQFKRWPIGGGGVLLIRSTRRSTKYSLASQVPRLVSNTKQISCFEHSFDGGKHSCTQQNTRHKYPSITATSHCPRCRLGCLTPAALCPSSSPLHCSPLPVKLPRLRSLPSHAYYNKIDAPAPPALTPSAPTPSTMQPTSASSSPPPSAASSFTVIDPSFDRRQLVRYGRPDTFVSASYGELPLLTKRELITPHVVLHTAHVLDVDSTITQMKGDIAATFKSAEYFCTLKLLFTLSIISQIDDTSIRRDKDVVMAAWVRDDPESPWKPSPRNKYMHKRRMLQSMRWAWLVCHKDDRETALLTRRPFFTLTTLRDLPDAVLEMDDVSLARM